VVAAGRAQYRQIRLRVALVLAAQGLGKRLVDDQFGSDRVRQWQRGVPGCAASGVDDCQRDIVERLGPPGTKIEQAAACGMVEKPEIDGNHIVDIDEIALLLTRSITAVGAEELDAALGAELVKLVKRHARHPSLVLLAWTIDIEVAKAHCLRDGLGETRSACEPKLLVEQQLRVAIHIQRPLELWRLAKHVRSAIGRGG